VQIGNLKEERKRFESFKHPYESLYKDLKEIFEQKPVSRDDYELKKFIDKENMIAPLEEVEEVNREYERNMKLAGGEDKLIEKLKNWLLNGK
jgi:hypothetical protein